MFRVYKIPKWPRRLFKGAFFDFPTHQSKAVYLTFDDGPLPQTTPLILEILENEGVKATFFCLGGQVQKHTDLFKQILANGHTVANHSMSHLKGTKTDNETYLDDVEKATSIIQSKIFRPPYGKIKPSQFRALKQQGYTLIFWSIMAFDFDQQLPPEQFVNKMVNMAYPGAVYVFHDNIQSGEVIKNELPKIIKGIKNQGYSFEKIEPKLFS